MVFFIWIAAMKLVIAVLVVFLGGALALKSFSGYQVLRTAPVTHATMKALRKMQSDPRFDFWAQPRVGRPADVMAAPEHVGELRAALQGLDLHPSIYIQDVGVTVEKERADIEVIRRSENKTARAVTYDRYMELDEIQDYIDELAATYPDLATIIEIGQSYEGRPIRVLKISNGGQKKRIIMDSLLHAREWAGPPVSMYTAQQLLENYEENKALIDLVDWYILPVANPDGYVFSWAEDRFWRKTRSLNEGSNCVGTDPNRNFDFHWNEGGGESECSLLYPGSKAFSEVECQSLANFWNELNVDGDLVLYMAIHSYGEILIYPYGYTTEPPPNSAEIIDAGIEAVRTLEAVSGTVYTVESASAGGFLSWGASDDYAMGAAKIPYSYTWELPGGGSGGFNPPNSAIKPTIEETYEGIVALVRRAAATAS